MGDRPSMHADRDRAESFGAEAQTYDRARPGYPRALIDELLVDAPQHALDVGCGTGKSGSLLAARGVQVLGVEPDERMAAVARGHGLEVEIGTIESWDPAGRRFDLVVSGQAWHWVDPARGPAKVLQVLRPGGRFAAFWNIPRLGDVVQMQLDAVYARLAPDLDPYSVVRGKGLAAAPGEYELEGFVDAEVRRYEWEQSYARAEWIELVLTHSDHARIAPAQQATLMDAVGDVIDIHGGTVTAIYTTYAAFARAP